MSKQHFVTIEEAGVFLRAQLEADINASLTLHKHAVLILPGGNSIKLFFPYLLSIKAPWEKITIALSDERCVPVYHEMSNEKQLKENFLNFLPVHNFCRLNEELTHKLKLYPAITVLSMGDDGHVASLFPEEYSKWKDKGIGIYKTKTKSPNRFTLTEKTILLSSNIYILVVGHEKNCFFNENHLTFLLNNIFENSTCVIC